MLGWQVIEPPTTMQSEAMLRSGVKEQASAK
jgi:hypothetical protein